MYAKNDVETLLKSKGGREEKRNKVVVWTLPNGLKWEVPRTDAPQEQWQDNLNKLTKLIGPVPVVPKPSLRDIMREKTRLRYLTSQPKKPKVEPPPKEKVEKRKPLRAKKLSEGFVKAANKVLNKQGEAAADKFIRTKKDIWKI